jgi:hypothetical protein
MEKDQKMTKSSELIGSALTALRALIERLIPSPAARRRGPVMAGHPDGRDVRRNPLVAVLGGLAYGLIQLILGVCGTVAESFREPKRKPGMGPARKDRGNARQ